MYDGMGALILARSCYSFGYGVETPARLVSSVPPGAAGIILADSNGLHGQAEFGAAAASAGIRAGAGARLRIGSTNVVLLSLSGGWSSLSKAVSGAATGASVDDPPDGCGGGLAVLVFRAEDSTAVRDSGFTGPVLGAVLPPGFGVPPEEAERAFMAAGIIPAACWPVVFTGIESVRVHRLVRASSLGGVEASLPGRAFASPRAMMPDQAGLDRAFAGCRPSLAGASEIASRLDVFRPAGRLLMSECDGESAEALRAVAREEYRRRYGRGAAAARRLEMELSSIAEAGLAGYFLAFGEVARFCAAEGIAATARGSAAGSMISYLLGISGVCPIRCGLSFSRFFNTKRPDPPDIDLDIDSLERDRVVSFVLDRWGDRAACVGEIVRHRRNSAFRCAAAAAGLGPSDTDAMCVLLEDPEAPLWKREPGRTLLRDAALLEGLPSHLAPHPCGMVLAPCRLCEVAPVSPGAAGRVLTQFDMTGVEQAGLLKMDLLGLRALSAISLASRWLGSARSAGLPLRPPAAGRREDFSAALALMAGGRTIGVAHVESPALRGLLSEMKVSSLDDVARALALVRPGASGNGSRERFFAARNGGSGGFWKFDELRDILAGSHGEMLYEEDVSECAARLLGTDDDEGDLVRRRLKKGRLTPEDIEAYGVERGRALRIHAFLSRFAGYGFCRAHAYSYAYVACISASIKAASPAEFIASVLAGGGGFYDQRTYVEEARRLGLSIVPPGVNSGDWGALPVPGGVMLGFSILRGMGRAEFDTLLRGRPYRSPSEVVAAGVGRQVVKSMAMAGCFDELGLTRPAALWGMNLSAGGFFTRAEEGLPEIPDYGPEERLALELRCLGVPVSASPLSLVDRPGGTVPLDGRPGERSFSAWGRVACRRSLPAGSGFLMLEDDRGYADVFLPAPLYRRARLIARREGSTLVMRVTAGRDGRMRASSVSAGPLTPCSLMV